MEQIIEDSIKEQENSVVHKIVDSALVLKMLEEVQVYNLKATQVIVHIIEENANKVLILIFKVYVATNRDLKETNVEENDTYLIYKSVKVWYFFHVNDTTLVERI